MKAGWKTVKLEEVCAVEFGERVVRKNDAGTMYPVYGGGGATFNIDRHNRESCVVVSRFGMSERCVRFVEGKFFLNDSGLTVTSTSPEAHQGYIDLLLHAKAPEIYALGGGTAQKNLDTKSFRGLEIPLPPLAEQKRIVALLDEAFAGIDKAKAKAEANLEDTSMILKSYLNSIFSQGANEWAEKTLGETCEMYQPKTIGMKDLIPDGPHPVFGANGVIGKYDKYNHEEPQLLITCRGATCGAVNISEPNSWITGNAMVVRPKDGEIDLQFLEFFFRGGVDISVAITGSAQPQITRTSLEPLTVRFPKSIVEQENHVKAFKSLTVETRTLANIYAQKLLMLNQLKNTLLAQAFAGELTA